MNSNSNNNSNNANDTINKIKKLYMKAGYMSKYGNDVWVSVIVCIIFTILICYYYSSNALQVVKTNWPEHRCNPLLIPFAGFINNPDHMSKTEFTFHNFASCINGVLMEVVEGAFQPFIFVIKILNEACQSLVDSVNLLRGLTSNVRNNFLNMFQHILSSLFNLVAYFINFNIKLKDTFGKIKSVLATTIYSVFGSYMALQSLFLGMVDVLVKFMHYGGHIILILILSAAALLAGFFTAPFASIPIGIGIPYTFIFFILLIPVLIYKYLILYYINLPTPPTPDDPDWSPVCFSGETIINVVDVNNSNNHIQTLLKDIKIGDVLINGEKVTAIIKGSSKNQTIYDINGILATAEHYVYDNSSIKWVKVKDHPNSKLVDSFNEPFVYCLNTDKKIITIANTLFLDWDDITDNVYSKLKNNCVNKNGISYLPKNLNLSDIHTYLDSGFIGSTKIVLNDGNSIPISKICPNDVLLNGVNVIGIVKINAKDMNIYTHYINDNLTIYGSNNLHIDDTNLGKINCMDLKSNYYDYNCLKEPFLYHLLTDKKSFSINGISFNHYNSGLDLYL